MGLKQFVVSIETVVTRSRSLMKYNMYITCSFSKRIHSQR